VAGVSRHTTAVAGALSFAVVAVLVTGATWSAFTARADNSGSLSAGTVVLTDDDADTSMFNLSGLMPGASATKCINVNYSGSLNAVVKLYGALESGNGLRNYLDLTIERSTGAAGGATADCTGWVDAGKTTIWTPANGTLGTFLSTATGFGTGLGNWSVTGGAPVDTASYRFTVSLQDDDFAAGKSTTVAFTWEAQNT
jgi:predicted ribosomally synthesized peptide with SipW-like signal peptide